MSSKKNRKPDFTKLAKFDLEEPTEELVLAEESVEEPVVEEAPAEVVEEVEEVKPAPKQSIQNGRAIVTSLRSWVYPQTDIFSNPVTAVARGNQLIVKSEVLVSEDNKKWLRVEIPRSGENLKGFIEFIRVKVL